MTGEHAGPPGLAGSPWLPGRRAGWVEVRFGYTLADLDRLALVAVGRDVRDSVARNSATAHNVLASLSHDPDKGVRAVAARRLAASNGAE